MKAVQTRRLGQPGGLDFANWQERKPLAAALRPIYTAPSAEAACAALDAFARGPWGTKFPTVVASWRSAWTHVIPFFAFPPEVQRVLYTTNALEGVHAQLRKIIKTRGHFPTDEAATKDSLCIPACYGSPSGARFARLSL